MPPGHKLQPFLRNPEGGGYVDPEVLLSDRWTV
jgi:hypothetical protein